MKQIGTLWCKLFGHKFISEGKPEIIGSGFYGTWIPSITTNHCVRCGIKREEL